MPNPIEEFVSWVSSCFQINLDLDLSDLKIDEGMIFESLATPYGEVVELNELARDVTAFNAEYKTAQAEKDSAQRIDSLTACQQKLVELNTRLEKTKGIVETKSLPGEKAENQSRIDLIEKTITTLTSGLEPLLKAARDELAMQKEQSSRREVLGKLNVEEATEAEFKEVVAKTADVVVEMRELLMKENFFHECTLDEFYKAMAYDDNSSLEAAIEKIDENKGRMFTAEREPYVDHIFFLKGAPGAEHDAVHETIHVCSAKGGLTDIKDKFGTKINGDFLNEGFTEFFAGLICKQLKVEYDPGESYPVAVGFVERLAKNVGYGLVYAAYMQNKGLDAIFDKIAKMWHDQRQEMLAGNFRQKGSAAPEALADARQRVYDDFVKLANTTARKNYPWQTGWT